MSPRPDPQPDPTATAKLPPLPDHDAAWKALQAAQDADTLARLQGRATLARLHRTPCAKLPEDIDNFGGFRKAVLAIVDAYPGTLDREEEIYSTAYKLEQHALKLRRAALPADKEKVGPSALTTLESALRVAVGGKHVAHLSPEERLAGIASDVRHFLTEVADRG